jgi:hypothetical protein
MHPSAIPPKPIQQVVQTAPRPRYRAGAFLCTEQPAMIQASPKHQEARPNPSRCTEASPSTEASERRRAEASGGERRRAEASGRHAPCKTSPLARAGAGAGAGAGASTKRTNARTHEQPAPNSQHQTASTERTERTERTNASTERTNAPAPNSTHERTNARTPAPNARTHERQHRTHERTSPEQHARTHRAPRATATNTRTRAHTNAQSDSPEHASTQQPEHPNTPAQSQIQTIPNTCYMVLAYCLRSPYNTSIVKSRYDYQRTSRRGSASHGTQRNNFGMCGLSGNHHQRIPEPVPRIAVHDY